MKSFLETISGLLFTAVLFDAAAIIYGLVNGDTGDEVAPFVGWGVAILAGSLVTSGLSKNVDPAPVSAPMSVPVPMPMPMPVPQRASRSTSASTSTSTSASTSTSTSNDEDLAVKENNRKVAVALAGAGGMTGIWARQWLQAHDEDPSIPVFGVRPYWTLTGQGGTPEPLSVTAYHGVERRLQAVRETTDFSTLTFMANDPNRRVREAVTQRLR